MAHAASDFSGRRPLILTVPGLGGSGPGHWQTAWEESRNDTARVDLGLLASPKRNAWVTRLDQAIRAAEAPVILAAHGLGCLTVAWWAELAGQPWGWPVAGALLVAPLDVEGDASGEIAHGFAPHPKTLLPFPSILVAGDDDPWCSAQRAFDMARDWGSHFVDAGSVGHINAESALGWWRDGQRLLDRVIGAAEGPVAHGGDVGSVQTFLQSDGDRVPA